MREKEISFEKEININARYENGKAIIDCEDTIPKAVVEEVINACADITCEMVKVQMKLTRAWQIAFFLEALAFIIITLIFD